MTKPQQYPVLVDRVNGEAHYDCATCMDTGEVSVEVGDWLFDVACPDCDMGNPS